GVLSGGRTAILYKEMVRDKQLALAVETDNYPGVRYPTTFIFFLVPSAGKTVDENQKALDAILEQFKSTKIDSATLQRVKTKTRAGLVRRLDSNSGLANLLSTYYALYGDWRKLFTSLDDLDKVTADDVQRVAGKYLVPDARTVAYTVPPPKPVRGAR